MFGMPNNDSFLTRHKTKVIAAVVVVLLAVVGGPFVYINFIKDDPPAELQVGGRTESDADTAGDGEGDATASDVVDCEDQPIAAGDLADVSGTWTVTDGSCAGYRVKEVLFGQDTEGVGRTPDVTGTMEISGTTVQATELTVQMATMVSDEDRRDNQFRTRIMSTDEFPTATFALTSPIELGELPEEGVQKQVEAVGDLTIRGVTKSVTFQLTAVRQGANIVVSGSVEIPFDDYSIPDASNQVAEVGRTGTLELLVVFAK